MVSDLADLYRYLLHHPNDAPLLAELRHAEQYLAIEGAFTAEYRSQDSSWSLASAEELESGLAKLRAIIDDGKKAAFIEEREAARKAGGQTTLVIARKK